MKENQSGQLKHWKDRHEGLHTFTSVCVYTQYEGGPREGSHQIDVFAFVVYLGKEEVGEHATMTWLYFIFLPHIISTFLLVTDKRELPEALNRIPICTETSSMVGSAWSYG